MTTAIDPEQMTLAELAAAVERDEHNRRGTPNAAACAVALAKLLEHDAELTAIHRWHELIPKWRKQLVDDALAEFSTPPRTPEARGRLERLKLSIQVLDRGIGILGLMHSVDRLPLAAVMAADGIAVEPASYALPNGRLPWLGTLDDLKARTVYLNREIANLRPAVENHVRSDEARAKRYADAKAKHDREGTIKTRGDGSRYRRFDDGRRVEIDDGPAAGAPLTEADLS